ncbi:MAG: hypothetical protein AAF927_19830 [Bacteroidota bacterium]
MATLFCICPHCLTENPAFGEQRCISCKLNMRSNQEQAILQKQLKPLVGQLDELMRSAEQNLRQIQPLLDQLAPYQQKYAFLEEVLQKTKTTIEPLQIAAYHKQKRLVIHWTILLALLIAPLLSSWWQAPLYLTGLFMLPVVGWLILGIWPLLRKKKA